MRRAEFGAFAPQTRRAATMQPAAITITATSGAADAIIATFGSRPRARTMRPAVTRSFMA